MDFGSNYEIARTADFIHSRSFTRVALQFPDAYLKDSVKIVRALKDKLKSLIDTQAVGSNGKEVGLFIMADTTYGSCCVDEVAAAHIDADCVIHYGHTCLSPTSTLPAFFVFGKAPITVTSFVDKLTKYTSTVDKPILVLYGLEYAHSIPLVKEVLLEALRSCESTSKRELLFADVVSSITNPSQENSNSSGLVGVSGGDFAKENSCALDSSYITGGLTWNLPVGHKMEDYLLVWIGSDNSAFANVVLTYNGCETVRYDAEGDQLMTDVSQKQRVLKRRYYLVEKAKDANIVGILVGTLGVEIVTCFLLQQYAAGYLHMIHQMKELITRAGKKAYTLIMGRPNPAKLANFPECDVFIYVSCAQTALLDSKDFLAPVITPFEASLAFNRGRQWTGEYVMEFRDLINALPVETAEQSKEARFSFIKGGYVEDIDLEETENREEDEEGSLALVSAAEKALQLQDRKPGPIIKGAAKSGAEFFMSRSYQGLEMHSNGSSPEPYFLGRKGKASGYEGENRKQ
ncbi:hypothetical protein ACFE04_005452 [Oxalis oulophora]